MIEAQYGEYIVVIPYCGQTRQLLLHVVKLNNPTGYKFFLFDMQGWAIDDLRVVENAKQEFNAGRAREIQF